VRPIVRTSVMDCAQLRRLLQGHGSLAPVDAREHLAACPACLELARDDGRLARGLSLPERAPGDGPGFEALAGAIARDDRWPARLKSLPVGTRWLVTFAALALPVLLALLRPRANLDSYPPLRLMVELAALAGLATAACAIWLRPLQRPRPATGALLLTLGLGLALPWFLAWLPPALGGGGGFRQALTCLGLGTAFALPVFIVTRLLGRHPGQASRLVLFPAVAAALAALAGLEIHCPISSRAHLLGGHAPVALLVPVVVLVVAGWRARRHRLPPARPPGHGAITSG